VHVSCAIYVAAVAVAAAAACAVVEAFSWAMALLSLVTSCN
jgi:hypothetical protein